jgi:TatD DNase family protein
VALVDTHCHLNFNVFDDDRLDVIRRADENTVTQMIIPATDLQTSGEALGLAQIHQGIFAAVGVHPNSTADFGAEHLAEIEALAQSPKVVAIGEIGIDYYWDKSSKAQQRIAFEAQLSLAAQLELPVIIHNRDASEDVLAILESWVSTIPDSLKNRPGVLHSFSASEAIAERALAAGFYLGITGPVTYKNADSLRHIAASIPMERLLIETDSPFLTPVPYRGKRNESAYVRLVAERIATLRQIPYHDFAAQTTKNAEDLFRLSTT